jgi:hypothetical protein
VKVARENVVESYRQIDRGNDSVGRARQYPYNPFLPTSKFRARYGQTRSMDNGFRDSRPWFTVTVTGHPKLFPVGMWAFNGMRHEACHNEELYPITSYLNACLSRRRGSCRLAVYCRDSSTGIDHAVRVYCDAKSINCLPISPQEDHWGFMAGFRRDAEMVIRSDAVVWFGPRESDGDPVGVAKLLGIPFREVKYPS